MPTQLRKVDSGTEAGESAGDSTAEMTFIRLGSRDGITQDVSHLGFEAAPTTSGATTQLLLHVVLEMADDELGHRCHLRGDDITISSDWPRSPRQLSKLGAKLTGLTGAQALIGRGA